MDVLYHVRQCNYLYLNLIKKNFISLPHVALLFYNWWNLAEIFPTWKLPNQAETDARTFGQTRNVAGDEKATKDLAGESGESNFKGVLCKMDKKKKILDTYQEN